MAKRRYSAELVHLGFIDRRCLAAGQQVERHDVGPPLFALAERLQNGLGLGRLLGNNQLQMAAKRGLNRTNQVLRHANLVGQQAKRCLRFLERGLGPGANPLVGGLQLLEHVEPRTLLCLCPQQVVEFTGELSQVLLQLGQALLAFLHRASAVLRVGLARRHLARELAKPLL